MLWSAFCHRLAESFCSNLVPLSCPLIAIMMMLEQASFIFVERTSRCFVNASVFTTLISCRSRNNYEMNTSHTQTCLRKHYCIMYIYVRSIIYLCDNAYVNRSGYETKGRLPVPIGHMGNILWCNGHLFTPVPIHNQLLLMLYCPVVIHISWSCSAIV